MTEDESLLAAINEVVDIVPYDPGWPGEFERERTRLAALFPGAFLAIEHFGSTAIPGMRAKPVIDLIAGVASSASLNDWASRPREAGYSTDDAFNASLSDRKWFMRWAHGRRTHHLHVVVHEGPVWCERLAFRDRLRADPKAAAQYESLKMRLAVEHRNDREAYTDAKAEFVRSIVG